MRQPPSTLAAVLLLGLAVPAATQMCGDCDRDGSISLLDALRAAQLATGLLSPAGTDYPVCDVNADVALSVLDVLAIAQVSVGMAIALGCSPGPGNAAPVASAVMVPSPASGTVLVTYLLADVEGDLCNLAVTVSIDGGSTYPLTPTEGVGGDGVAGLTSSPAGTFHVFAWDSLADLGTAAVPQVIVRLVPSDTQPGVAATSSPVLVDNRLPGVVSYFLDIEPSLLDVTPSGMGCVNCHSGATPPAGLDLSSYTGLLIGSGSGAVVLPGDAASSLVICKLEGLGMCGSQMPLGGTPWGPAMVQQFRDWIDQGAQDN